MTAHGPVPRRVVPPVTDGPAPCIVRELPLRVESVNQACEHYFARQRRHATAHRVVRKALEGCARPALPVIVAMTRVARSELDFDNWVGAAKPIRDAIADFIRLNDRDPRIDWVYLQEKRSEKVRLATWDGHGNQVGWRNAYRVFVRVEIWAGQGEP